MERGRERLEEWNVGRAGDTCRRAATSATQRRQAGDATCDRRSLMLGDHRKAATGGDHGGAGSNERALGATSRRWEQRAGTTVATGCYGGQEDRRRLLAEVGAGQQRQGNA